jgi:hypothetical protein
MDPVTLFFQFLAALAKPIWNALAPLAHDVAEFWNGRKIAIIGPPGAGKNSFWARLRDDAPPIDHKKTANPEPVHSFLFSRRLPDGRGPTPSASLVQCL